MLRKTIKITNKKIIEASLVLISGFFLFQTTKTPINFKPSKETIRNIIKISSSDGVAGISVDTTGNGKADTLYMWGDNSYGQLGNGVTKPTINPTPSKVEGLPKGEIIDFDFGNNFSGAIIDTSDDGKGDSLYMWGDNQIGELGIGVSPNGGNGISEGEDYFSTPQKVEFQLSNYIITDFELGLFHSGVILDTNDDGKGDSLYMWGYNSFGQLGLGDSPDISDGNQENFDYFASPQKVQLLPKNDEIVDLSLGTYHSGVIIDTTLDGKGDSLYMWGDNEFGQLGNEVNTSIKWGVNSTPIMVENLPKNSNIIEIDSGRKHTGAILDTNDDGKGDSLYMWGSNEFGQLGTQLNSGSTTDANYLPTKINDEENNDLINFHSGNDHSGVTLDTNDDGKGDSLYLWGSNEFGQLGNDTNFETTNPNHSITKVEGLPKGEIINFSLGEDFSEVLIDTNSDANGDTIYAWGNNECGQLGFSETYSYDWRPKEIDLNYTIPLIEKDYEIESIDSIEYDETNSNVLINPNFNYFGNDSEDEREIKINISNSENDDHLILEKNLNETTGQIIIENEDNLFNSSIVYFIDSIEYNSTQNIYDGYKYIYTPEYNNSFEIYDNNKNYFSWWKLLLIIILFILILIIIFIIINRYKRIRN